MLASFILLERSNLLIVIWIGEADLKQADTSVQAALDRHALSSLKDEGVG